MNFRNLQAAVGCYFDFLSSSNQNINAPLPSMRICRELTVGLGESVTPNTQFTQSWLLENNGDVAWPQGCYLKLVSEINNDGKMFVPAISPHDTTIITINLVSPSNVGQFRSQFCLCTPNGSTFGPIIWSVVDISTSGTLSLTQQLTQLHASQPKETQHQQLGPVNYDEDGMDVAGRGSTSMALLPHCSNTQSGFSVPNHVNTLHIFQLSLSNILFSFQNLLPAPQNSPNTHDEDMVIEKINAHNL